MTEPIESVAKALRVLALFEGTNAPLRLVDASRALGLPQSSTHRLLATLQSLGYVERDPRRRTYYAGPSLIGLAASLLRDVELRTAANVEMARMLRGTSRSTSLVVLRDARVYFVSSLHREALQQAEPRAGMTLALHSSASGKAFLAEASREDFFALVPTERLTPRRAATTRTRLARELETVRRMGFATSIEETATGVAAVASTIKSRSGTVYGALNVVAPAHAVRERDLLALGCELRASCARIAGHFP